MWDIFISHLLVLYNYLLQTSSKHLSPYLCYIVHVSCTSLNSHSTCLKSDTEIICLSKDKLLTLHIGSCARISHNSATVAEHGSLKRK